MVESEGVTEREGDGAALRLSVPAGDGLPVADVLGVGTSEPEADGVDAWLGERVPDAEAVLPCEGVTVGVRPPVTLCVGEPLREGSCDAEVVMLGDGVPLTLALGVPLGVAVMLGEPVRAWLGEAVDAWVGDDDGEGDSDAVTVAVRERDALCVGVSEDERVAT